MYFSREDLHLFLIESRRLYSGEILKTSKQNPFWGPQLYLEVSCMVPAPCCWPNAQCPNCDIYVNVFPIPPCLCMSLFVTSLASSYSFCCVGIYTLCATVGASVIFPVNTWLTHPLLSYSPLPSPLFPSGLLSSPLCFQLQRLKRERESRKKNGTNLC